VPTHELDFDDLQRASRATRGSRPTPKSMLANLFFAVEFRSTAQAGKRPVLAIGNPGVAGATRA
jgi:hypothetical protein